MIDNNMIDDLFHSDIEEIVDFEIEEDLSQESDNWQQESNDALTMIHSLSCDNLELMNKLEDLTSEISEIKSYFMTSMFVVVILVNIYFLSS